MKSNVNFQSGSSLRNDNRTKICFRLKSRPQKPIGNAFHCVNPTVQCFLQLFPEGGCGESPTVANSGNSCLDNSRHVVLVNSKGTKVVLYVDETPSSKPYNFEDTNVNYISSSFVLGDSPRWGLGYCDESEATPSGIGLFSEQEEENHGEPLVNYSSSEEEMDGDEELKETDAAETCISSISAEMTTHEVSREKNSSFLSIGGRKLLTEDISDGDHTDDGQDLRLQPVSFASSESLKSETVETTKVDSKEESSGTPEDEVVLSSTEVGTIELYTKGFGSKLMAKMGYVEGEGLGKDGQGMSRPIEVVQRPKSLGLGAKFSNTRDDMVKILTQRIENLVKQNKSESFEAFEQHTKGFGSTMMVKMGFVQGGVLGKDDQGVQRPKSLGLGVDFFNTGKDAVKTNSQRVENRVTQNKRKRLGAFEEHTKGFGSKMLAKMGFVEGMGLGGMTNPLVVVRLRPKSRGLDAKA